MKSDSFEKFLAEQDDEFIQLHNRAKIRVACNAWRYADFPAEVAWAKCLNCKWNHLENYMVDAPAEWRAPWPTSRNAAKFFGKRHPEMLRKTATPTEIIARMNCLFDGQLVVCAGFASLDLFQKLLDAAEISPQFELVQGCGPNFSIPVKTEAGIVRSHIAFQGYC